jgi:hypothetical protein
MNVADIVYKDFAQLSFQDVMVYEAIPPHPFWSLVDKVIDFSFADDLCAPLYSEMGPRPYPPSLKLKAHLVQRYYDISDREMELKIIGDIYIKRFLGLPIDHAKFDHSTLGLDRSRLGAEMFKACHHHILAQALANGLWGQDDDRWLVDAFHTYARVSKPSTYELIRGAIYKVLHHMKVENRVQYDQLEKERDVPAMRRCIKPDTKMKDRWVAFSSLVMHAYGLLTWIKKAEKGHRFPWELKAHKEFLEHVDLLERVLRENVQPVDGADSGDPENHNSEETQKYREIPNKEKPGDRIVSVHTIDVRAGAKSKTKKFTGDKVQVVESSKSRLILNAEPIPGNENDGEALFGVVEDVMKRHSVTPKEIVADSAYGAIENRHRVQQDLHTRLTSPVPPQGNEKNLFTNEQFQYLPEQGKVICPGEKTSYRSTYIKQSKGTQFFFRDEDCQGCPMRTQCTTSKAGRTAFFTDHWELLEEAKQYNKSKAGQAAMKTRYEIERTNNEMKNHHGLVRPRTRGRDPLKIDAKLTAMVINLKIMVKALRQGPKSVQMAGTTS